MREKTIEEHLVKAVRLMGGLAPKFVSPGLDGVPDRLLLLPNGRMAFADPDIANRILRDGALDRKKICLACSKCTELMRAGHTPGCVVRDPLYTGLYRQVFRNQPE